MKKYNLNDVTFLLVVRLDTIERLENVLHVVRFLHAHFQAQVLLWEVAAYNNGLLSRLIPRGVKYVFCQDCDPVLYRTHYINDMVKSANTSFVSVWDVDVVVPLEQVIETMKLLREGSDFVYPYDRHFYDTTDELRRIYLRSGGDIAILEEHAAFMLSLYAPNPVGGVFFANRQSYLESGLESERFYGWGLEDGERYNRWKNLDYKVSRVSGDAFHLTHPRLDNSNMGDADVSIMKKRELMSSLKRTLWKKY